MKEKKPVAASADPCGVDAKVRTARIVTMRLQFTEHERAVLLSRAKQAGMTASQWIGEMTRKSTIRPRLSAEDLEHLRMLAQLANALHVFAEKIDSAGLPDDIPEFLEQLRGVETVMEKIGRR